jgi:hypothetical protein
VISASIVPRERELNLAHAQRSSFLVMEHCIVILSVEIVPGKQVSTAISATSLPRERELCLAHAHWCSFLITLKCCGPQAVELVPESTALSAPILPREREISLEHAQRCIFLIIVQRLWSPCSRNGSRKALRFQHLSCQESESSVWRIRGCAVS